MTQRVIDQGLMSDEDGQRWLQHPSRRPRLRVSHAFHGRRLQRDRNSPLDGPADVVPLADGLPELSSRKRNADRAAVTVRLNEVLLRVVGDLEVDVSGPPGVGESMVAVDRRVGQFEII